MSSKRKKNQGDDNASSRNLDGRRLRTVNEAKALAEYLAIKPDMAKKDKEERRKRWEQVVEVAERREEEIKSGRKGMVDGKWVEDKEEAGERTREAVRAAMMGGTYKDNLVDVQMGQLDKSQSESEEDEQNSKGTTPPSDPEHKLKPQAKRFFGFDEEEDEFMSDDENDEEVEGEAVAKPVKDPMPPPAKLRGKTKAKGKGKAQ